MSEIHALSGAYVTDGLDDVERARFERHLRTCPICVDEIDGLRETVSLLAETTASEPPAALRARVLADIAMVRPLPPLVAPVATRRPPRLRRGLAAAAAAVVLAGTGAAAWHPWTGDAGDVQEAGTTTQQVMRAADATHATKEFNGGGRFTLYRSPRLGRAVLVSTEMSDLPDGRTYEVWLKHGNDYVPAGTFDGVAPVLLEGDTSKALGVAVTVEPSGGSDVPTTAPIAEFPFEQA